MTLSTRHQVIIGIILAAFMIATRGHHFPDIRQILPSASWAVFFLVGVYLRALWVPAVFFALASFLDFSAINWQGVSDYCVSPAYIALIPAYGALWFGGRWFSKHLSEKPVALLYLGASLVVSTFVCQLISSGSFYYFSGRFAEPTFGEFASRIIKYYPSFSGTTLFWITVTTIVHVAIVLSNRYAARSERA